MTCKFFFDFNSQTSCRIIHYPGWPDSCESLTETWQLIFWLQEWQMLYRRSLLLLNQTNQNGFSETIATGRNDLGMLNSSQYQNIVDTIRGREQLFEGGTSCLYLHAIRCRLGGDQSPPPRPRVVGTSAVKTSLAPGNFGAQILAVDTFGARRAAIFCCLSSLCCQIESDSSLDVYQVAKLAWQRRPNIFQSVVSEIYVCFLKLFSSDKLNVFILCKILQVFF